jgi:hypothetical protein
LFCKSLLYSFVVRLFCLRFFIWNLRHLRCDKCTVALYFTLFSRMLVHLLSSLRRLTMIISWSRILVHSLVHVVLLQILLQIILFFNQWPILKICLIISFRLIVVLINYYACWIACQKIYFNLKVIFNRSIAIVLSVFLIRLYSSFIHVCLETLVYVLYIVDLAKKIGYEGLLNL